jgi:hypothetical protein
MMKRIENTIPAIAPAREAFKWSRITVALFSSIISSLRERDRANATEAV